ncbi:MAG: prolyl oligopeptidase family serine peptidase [Myxococcota bacterium]
MRHVLLSMLSFVVGLGCGGSAGAREQATLNGTGGTMEALHALNREARAAGATVDTLHGVRVADPYRSLEARSPLTDRWIDAQSERTAAAVEPSDALRERLDTFLSIGALGGVSVGGRPGDVRIFFSRREGDRQQPRIEVRAGERTLPLVDPETLGERAAVDWTYPSPSGRWLAFGVSQNGDERSVLHLLDVDAMLGGASFEEALAELRIPRTKWCRLDWLPDESGFYYTRYPAPGEPDYDAEEEDGYFPRVFFHALGSDPAADPKVFGAEDGADFPSAHVSSDGRWVTINVLKGWSRSEVFLLSRASGPAPSEAAPLRPVVRGADAVSIGFVHGDHLYLHTNEGAPNYTLRRAPLGDGSADFAFEELIAEREAPLESVAFTAHGIAAQYLDDLRAKVVLFDGEGVEKAVATLPGDGALGGIAGQPELPGVYGAFDAFATPPTLLRIDGASGATESLVQVDVGVDLSGVRVERELVTSADGTQVPLWLVMSAERAGRRDGDAPVLLYGYGGFNVSLRPGFRRNVLYWLERGGVFALANLRGGGERGEAWHRAGMLGEKERVFEDFEACIAWLSESGLSRPERIAIEGGSNGGLLMAAMVTRVPERFAAAASYVGLYDMVRYHLFPPAELWVPEYGSADDPEQLRWLLAYSPYHQVREGVRYPAVLIETADHDSRVHWAHSTKLAAALQEATAGEAPIYFYMQRNLGHGAGTRRSDLVERYARMYAFLEGQLGL